MNSVRCLLQEFSVFQPHSRVAPLLYYSSASDLF